MAIYGHRARVGYAAPPVVTEVFPYEFYKVVPSGVTLGLTTLAVAELSDQALLESAEISLRAAREMARRGMDVVVFGGVPINLKVGLHEHQQVMASLQEECGVPITSSLLAQSHALKTLKSKKIAQVHPLDNLPPSFWTDWESALDPLGVELVGVTFGPYKSTRELGQIPVEVSADLTREAAREHPEADTIVLHNSHWATAEQIDSMERELGVNIVSFSLACIWEGLRLAGVTDSIAGYGRLLKEH